MTPLECFDTRGLMSADHLSHEGQSAPEPASCTRVSRALLQEIVESRLWPRLPQSPMIVALLAGRGFRPNAYLEVWKHR